LQQSKDNCKEITFDLKLKKTSQVAGASRHALPGVVV